MPYVYAELNESGIVKAVSRLSGEVVKNTMIPIESMDSSLMGKKYIEATGVFEAVIQPEAPPVYTLEDIKTDLLELKANVAIVKERVPILIKEV